MAEAPLDEVELAGLVYSLRQLADTFLVRLPGADPLPPLTNPFEMRAELQNVADVLKSLCRQATDQEITALRDLVLTPDGSEAALNARVRRNQIRFYNRILIERGLMKPPVNAPKGETTEVHAFTLRLIIASFMLNIPDEEIIEANRSTYYQRLAFDPAPDDANAEAIALSMDNFMEFLGKFMDHTGITDRFLAALPPKELRH